MKNCRLMAVLFAASFCLAGTLQAQEDFEARAYKSADGKTLNYRIHIPAQTDPKLKYPLVLFLHGAGERGSDNKKQLIHGTKDILTYSTNNGPAIIIAPQCPEGLQWVDTPWSNDSHEMPAEPSLPMKLAIELVETTISSLPVDKARVYVTGISMGGYGTWDIIQRRPEMFAAAIPVCGGGDTNQALRISKLPLWAFHGDKDTVVKTKRSRDMINAIKEKGGKPSYTEYPGVGHNAWSPTYSDPKVLKWLFDQKKTE